MQTSIEDNTHSPKTKEKNEFKLLSTPKTNKSKVSTTPIKNSRLKKSKRRDCTPLYSPPQLMEGKEEGNFRFFTDKKGNFTFGKLNFETEDLLFQPNTHYKPVKSNFLELVEESLNEFNGTYLDLLENQTTPDTIFTTLFNGSKENPEKLMKNHSKVKNDDIQKVHSEIESLGQKINEKDFYILHSMKTKVVVLNSECNYSEVSLDNFEKNFIGLMMNERDGKSGQANVISVPGKVHLWSSFIEDKLPNEQDEVYSIFKDVKLIFSIEKNLQAILTCIEVHLF